MQFVSLTSAPMKGEMLGLGDAFIKAILGYGVVFVGLVLLMIVIIIVGKIMVARMKSKAVSEEKTAPVEAAAAPEPVKEKAPGSAGECKLYDTDPKVAAMIMAIVADQMGKPLNELRFKSIKEVK
ncbi:MAG: OadG family protein [Lachnospiraceae bacterium]|nr:OadG family protein [Lachnospiraceae bacterium]MBR0153022.1 OadG family protein [Lachnospiraceae bacterium]